MNNDIPSISFLNIGVYLYNKDKEDSITILDIENDINSIMNLVSSLTFVNIGKKLYENGLKNTKINKY